MKSTLNITILGLSITSSWGNGHATTFRGLVRELSRRGHRVTFLERDMPWYAAHRDLPDPEFCKTILYQSPEELHSGLAVHIKEADLVIVGSYVPDGVQVGRHVIEAARGLTAFYDIDTPVTIAKLEKEDYEYLHPSLVQHYSIYLSFTGGPTLKRLEKLMGSPMARPLYCAVDPEIYFPVESKIRWDIGYLGTYSVDRQKPLEDLMLDAASNAPERKFVVAGPQYPGEISWPPNVERIEHLPPAGHRDFYNSQHFTLNLTRSDMVKSGFSPSVRLFEAAACGTPVISDFWEGIDSFFEPDEEILISANAEDTLRYLKDLAPDDRKRIGKAAREKVLQNHTAAHRALELENYYNEAVCRKQLQGQPMEDLPAK